MHVNLFHYNQINLDVIPIDMNIEKACNRGVIDANWAEITWGSFLLSMVGPSEFTLWKIFFVRLLLHLSPVFMGS